MPRHNGPQNLGMVTASYSKKWLKHRGFETSQMITHWQDIVGKQLCHRCAPMKVQASKQSSHKTLIVHVYDSTASMELAYMEPIIVEKIAMFFGSKMVDKIRVIQKPQSQKKVLETPEPDRTLSEVHKEKIKQTLQDIEDPGLYEALYSLGANVYKE